MSLKIASKNKNYGMATYKGNNEAAKEKKNASITEKNNNPSYVIVCIMIDQLMRSEKSECRSEEQSRCGAGSRQQQYYVLRAICYSLVPFRCNEFIQWRGPVVEIM
jgi:hypothetical protein